MSVNAWAASDIGRKRRHNEDSFLVDPDLGLYVVADGMGGHAAGDVASTRCVEIVREELLKSKAIIDNVEGDSSKVETALAKAIEKACADIHAMGEADKAKRGMGTTCVALIAKGKRGVIGHVGDSRIYLRRGGKVHQLTEDHSLIEEYVRRGLMTRPEAEKSEIRNVITRAVGIQPSVQVDTLSTDVIPGDVFMLCSDGLHGYLKDGELETMLAREPRGGIPQSLIDLANTRGGKDNITAVVVAAAPDTEGEEGTDVDAKAEILRRIPLFQYMTYKELLTILALAKGRSYVADDEIVREGAPSDEMFVLFRGKVEIVKGGQAIASLKAGGHFGEMGLIDQAPRSATVRATEATQAVSLPRETLLKLMRKDSALAVKLLWSFTQVLSDRLRSTNDQIRGLKDEVDRLRGDTVDFEEDLAPPPPPPPPFGDD